MTAKKNITAFIIIGVLGTLGHFVYEWSGEVTALGLFFPVNESTWEHLKLLFFPSVLYFAVEYFLLREKPKCYIPACVLGIFIGILTIVAVFYTYRGVIGKNIDFINILIYFLGLGVTLAVRNLSVKNLKCNRSPKLPLLSIFVMTLLFVIFSFNPPDLGIFISP